MGINVESRINSTQAKDAIYKAHDINSYTWGKNIVNKIKAATRIDIIGDSITYGVGVATKQKLWSLNFKKLLASNTGATNIGFVTANDANENLQEHLVSKQTIGLWSANFTNHNSINGFTYDCNTANEYINFYTEQNEQTVANIHYVKPLVNSVYEIYVNNTLSATITEVANGSSTKVKSSNITLSSIGNDIKVKLISGTLSISGVEYSNGTSKNIQVYATGGRRVSYLGNVLTDYLSADVCFFALGYNDVQNGSTAQQKLDAETYLETIAQNFIVNNKLFVYINFVWDTVDSENWVLQKLINVFDTYENFYIFNFASTINNNLGVIANSDYRLNTLLEWSDVAHPNNNGSNRIFRYISKKVFNEYNPTLISPIRDVNESLVSSSSTVGATAKKSIALGYSNVCEQPYTFVVGSRGTSKNQGYIIGNSTDTGKIRQINVHQRQIVTSNAIETYLRDATYSFPYNTQSNTIIIIKGYVVATDLINGLNKEFEVDAKFINNNGTLTIVVDSGYPVNGVNAIKGSLNVSMRIVPIGTAIRFYVTGIATTVYWNSKIEVEETTIGY